MPETYETRKDLPPEAKGNPKWRDTTDALWMRSSLSQPDSEVIVEVATFDDGFRAVRDGKSPEKGTLFFTPTEWEAGHSTIRERYRLLLARVLQTDAATFTEHALHHGEAGRVRAVTEGVITLDELTGGADLVPMAVRNARAAHQSATLTQDPQMASAAAEALQVAGWLAFDADDQPLARRLTSASVLTAGASGDHLAELFALSQLAMQDTHEQRPDQARKVCDHALGQDLAPRVRGLFELRLARAQGQEGTPVRAVEMLNRARSRLRGESPDRDPPWTWWVTDAELAWHEAMIHADNDQWDMAADLFEAAVHGRPNGYRRGMLNDAAHLVHALVRVRSWRRATRCSLTRLSQPWDRSVQGAPRPCSCTPKGSWNRPGRPLAQEPVIHAIAGLGSG